MLQIKVSIFRNMEKGSIYNLIRRRYHSIFFIFTVIFVAFGTVKKSKRNFIVKAKYFYFGTTFSKETIFVSPSFYIKLDFKKINKVKLTLQKIDGLEKTSDRSDRKVYHRKANFVT